AVAAEDIKALTMVPGIGTKGAQRIVLELAGRLGAPEDAERAAAGASGGGPAAATGVPTTMGALTWRDQVRTGLVNLGWQARDAEQAIAMIEPDLRNGDGHEKADIDVAVALRAALRVLGRA
ncbi:MAG TPA: helix-hairpin-helix domain-containing protein, partial [Streptosporangiaceae bacterium]|nr:helix-hairpin-helix domain-containing protein [Streptosporangiaceae bacterium]